MHNGKKSYVITINLNGGSGDILSSYVVKHGDKIPQLAKPELLGCYFYRWDVRDMNGLYMP